MSVCPEGHCGACWGRQRIARPIVVTYRAQGYCQVCDHQWVGGQMAVEKAYDLVPRRLRQAKDKAGWTSRSLCSRVDVTDAMMSRYFREDEPTYPSLLTLMRLCAAIGTHPNEVLAFEDPRVARLEADNKKYREALAAISEALTTLGLHLGDRPDLNLGKDNLAGHWERQEARQRDYEDNPHAD